MQSNWMAAVVAVLATSAALAQETPQDNVITILEGPNETRQVIVRSADGPAVSAFAVAQETDKGLYTVGDEFELKVEPGPHWIGLGCNAAPDSLRSQLGLGETGVVVYDIIDKSPAQAAGFEKHDVLTKAVVGDKEIALKDAPDLVQAVKEAKLQPIKVEVRRSGKTLTLAVTPAERPQPQGAAAWRVSGHPHGVYIDREKVQQLLKDGKTEELKEYIAQQVKEVQSNIRFHMTGPVLSGWTTGVYGSGTGTATVTKTATTASIPDDVSITITRTDPAERSRGDVMIKVKRGAREEWGATENELDTLPDDLRKHVEAMLHSLVGKSLKERATKRFVGGPKTAPVAPHPVQPPKGVPGLPPAAVPASPVPSGFGAGGGGFGTRFGGDDASRKQQQQLDRLEKQLEELRQAIEKLAPKN